MLNQPAFFFNTNLCTGCAACTIACQIENNRLPVEGKPGIPPWRTIYSRNPQNLPGLESFHLSLACNHCVEPACLLACPAAAITKDSLTGAVLINPKRCLGCGYCAWACPFDAPKYNQTLGTMEKCTFCQPRLRAGSQPACTTACPTGALGLGLLSPELPGTMAGISGFPKTTLKPAIRFEPLRSVVDQSVVKPPAILNEAKDPLFLRDPLDNAAAAPRRLPQDDFNARHAWPLWVLTVSMPLLFAWFAGLPAGRHAPEPWLDAAMLAAGLLALGISTLHLGKPGRFWRVLANVNTSWLSREILFVSAFLVLSGAAYGLARSGTNDFLYRSGMLVQTSLLLLGALALYSIDHVYAVVRFQALSPEEIYRPRLQLHSAMTFLGGFYLAGIVALAGGALAQLLQASLAGVGAASGALQLCLYANRHAASEPATPAQALARFLRVTAGFVLPGILLAANASLWLPVGFAGLGFAIDRAEFYASLKRVTPG